MIWARGVVPPEAEWFTGAADFSVLSCDIFETILWRILSDPRDLFLAAGYRAAQAGLTACTADAFAVYRAAAARRVRARVEAAGDDEISIDDVYAELAACGVLTKPKDGVDIEFAVECVVCRPVIGLRSAWDDLARLAPATRRIFVSDTYWPANRLGALLQHCGLDGHCRVFSSADWRRSKHTGRLFDIVLTELGCEAPHVLHVGDNPVSDVQRPRARGLQARHVRRRRAAKSTKTVSADPIVRLAQSFARARCQDPERELPVGPGADGMALANLATPILIAFALFVLAQARSLGIGRIYFLARDGYLPLAICKRILADRGESGVFDLTYLHVSRAALQDDDAIIAYLVQTGFLSPGPVLVVDLGWRGTVQARLAELRGATAGRVHGAYLGLWTEALRPALGVNDAAGYLFSFGAPAARQAVLRDSYIVTELIFSAPHGTVLGYRSGTPVMENETGAPANTRRQAFAALEAACLETVNAVSSLIDGQWPEAIDPDEALAPLLGLLICPRHEDVAMINRIPFIHGEEFLRPAVNALPLHEALLHPERSLQRLRNAPWRAGAVRAALPWPLPGMAFEDLEHRANRLLGLFRTKLDF